MPRDHIEQQALSCTYIIKRKQKSLSSATTDLPVPSPAQHPSISLCGTVFILLLSSNDVQEEAVPLYTLYHSAPIVVSGHHLNGIKPLNLNYCNTLMPSLKITILAPIKNQ